MLTVQEMRAASLHPEFGNPNDIRVKKILEILDDCAQEILDVVDEGSELDEIPSTTSFI